MKRAVVSDRSLSSSLSPQHILLSLFPSIPLHIPNDSPWVFSANLVRKASAGLILPLVGSTHCPTRPMPNCCLPASTYRCYHEHGNHILCSVCRFADRCACFNTQFVSAPRSFYCPLVEGLGFSGSYDIGPTIRGAQDANGCQQVSDDAPSNPIRLGSRWCRGFLPGTHSLGM